MTNVFTAWLNGLTGSIEGIAFGLLLLLNGTFVLGIFITRSYRAVDRWTKPLLVADAVLVGAAVGTPIIAVAFNLAAKGATLAVTAAAGLFGGK
jgi:hypothetical protein